MPVELSTVTVKKFFSALNEAYQEYGNFFTRPQVNERIPTNTTERNVLVKLYYFLLGKGGTTLKSYKYRTLSKLFKLEANSDQEAKEAINSVVGQLKKLSNIKAQIELAEILQSGNANVCYEHCLELVQVGADPNETDNWGRTLLYTIIDKLAEINANKEEIEKLQKDIDILVGYGALVEGIRDKKDRTPLSYMLNNNFHIDVAMHLISLGASPCSRGYNNNTIMHTIVTALSDINTSGDTKGLIRSCATQLMEKDYRLINILNDDSKTPYDILLTAKCALLGILEDLMQFIEWGANSNATDDAENTLLHKLAYLFTDPATKEDVLLKIENHMRKLVTNYKADLNLHNNNNVTPLNILTGVRANIRSIELANSLRKICPYTHEQHYPKYTDKKNEEHIEDQDRMLFKV